MNCKYYARVLELIMLLICILDRELLKYSWSSQIIKFEHNTPVQSIQMQASDHFTVHSKISEDKQAKYTNFPKSDSAEL